MNKIVDQYGAPYQPPPPVATPPSQPSVSVDALIDALTKIREASLHLIIAFLMIGIGVTVVIASALALVPMGFALGKGAFGLALGMLIILVLVTLIGAIFALIAILGKLVPGSESLAKIAPEFNTACSLIRVGFKWGIILLLIGVLTLIILIGIILLLVGYIFIIIGSIGLIILCFNFNDRFKNALYMVTGIMFIIGIFIPIVEFIAWILFYIALGDTISRLRSQQPTPYPTAPPPPPV